MSGAFAFPKFERMYFIRSSWQQTQAKVNTLRGRNQNEFQTLFIQLYYMPHGQNRNGSFQGKYKRIKRVFTFSQVFAQTPVCFHQCYLSGSSSLHCCFIHSRHFLVSICLVNIKPRKEKKKNFTKQASGAADICASFGFNGDILRNNRALGEWSSTLGLALLRQR